MGSIKSLRKSNRQKGMALIIAIGFLAVLSILGVTVLTLTQKELKIVAETKPASIAFYVADAAIEYSMNPSLRKYMGDPVNNPIDLVTDTAIGENELPLSGVVHKDIIDAGFRLDAEGNDLNLGRIAPQLLSGKVTNLSTNSALPPQLEGLFFSSDFRCALYQVDVSAESADQTVRISAAIADMYDASVDAHSTTGLGPDTASSSGSGAGGGS